MITRAPQTQTPYASADMNDYRRRMAHKLLEEGTSAAPVQHWTQGAARMAQALVGGMYGNQAREGDEALRQSQIADQASARSYSEQQRQAQLAQEMKAKQDMMTWQRGLPPTPDEQADLDYKRAQIEKLRSESSGQGGTSYGMTGTIVQDPKTGKFYSARWAKDGTTKFEELTAEGASLQPSRGVAVEGSQMYDKATGAPVRDMTGPIQGGETAKIVGRETGEGRMALPKISRALQSFEAKSNLVDGYIDEAKGLAGATGATGFVGGLSKAIPNTPAYALARKIDPIIANLGFDELQSMRDNSPTGGALGQVAVQELAMLQSTLGSLDVAQDSREVIATLDKIKTIRAQFRELRRQAYEQDVARFGVGAVPSPEAGAGQPAPPPVGRSAPARPDSGFSMRRLD